eukprot:TRINITY_DN21994_c0_g1_i2.p1 TRINITY_DN21994_c0_g1~~TRINITY_DN21994_c0_g1_i2.p1  ORF type:complete len:128 (-),score=2.99 TRINITY_DN21994_c0_g1_i2:100-483(-)
MKLESRQANLQIFFLVFAFFPFLFAAVVNVEADKLHQTEGSNIRILHLHYYIRQVNGDWHLPQRFHIFRLSFRIRNTPQKTRGQCWIIFHQRRDVFWVPMYSALIPCLLYTSPSPRDLSTSRMPSSA